VRREDEKGRRCRGSGEESRLFTHYQTYPLAAAFAAASGSEDIALIGVRSRKFCPETDREEIGGEKLGFVIVAQIIRRPVFKPFNIKCISLKFQYSALESLGFAGI
jgi:hypothetical protein